MVTTLGKIVLKKQKICRVPALWHSAKYCLKKFFAECLCDGTQQNRFKKIKKNCRVPAVRHSAKFDGRWPP
jgi:hypothetical protein